MRRSIDIICDLLDNDPQIEGVDEFGVEPRNYDALLKALDGAPEGYGIAEFRIGGWWTGPIQRIPCYLVTPEEVEALKQSLIDDNPGGGPRALLGVYTLSELEKVIEKYPAKTAS